MQDPIDFSDKPVVALIDASAGASHAQVSAMVEFAYVFAGKAGGVMLFHDTEIRGEPMALDAASVAGIVSGRVGHPGGGGSHFAFPVEQAVEVAARMGPERLLVLNDFVMGDAEIDAATRCALSGEARGIQATFVGCCDKRTNSLNVQTDKSIERVRLLGARGISYDESKGMFALREAAEIGSVVPSPLGAQHAKRGLAL